MIDRVSRAKVTVDGVVTGEIGLGLLVLLGVAESDSESDAAYILDKIANLRIFDDENGKMNLSVMDAKGGLLVVSQFTLYGDTHRGRRPSFISAAKPEIANRLYDFFVAEARKKIKQIGTGQFQAMMVVELVNDGPVTIILDSEKTI